MATCTPDSYAVSEFSATVPGGHLVTSVRKEIITILEVLFPRLREALGVREGVPSTDRYAQINSTSNATVESEPLSSGSRPIRQSLSRLRRFTRRTSAETSAAANPAVQATSNAVPEFNLDNLLPAPPEPPVVASSLFTMVQRLAELCQPKPVGALMQRSSGRRAVGEVISTSSRCCFPSPLEDRLSYLSQNSPLSYWICLISVFLFLSPLLPNTIPNGIPDDQKMHIWNLCS